MSGSLPRLAVLVTIAAFAGAGLASALLSAQRSAELIPPVSSPPVWVPITAHTETGLRTVDFQVRWEQNPAIRVTSAHRGLVLEIRQAPRELESGERVLRTVDGWILAYAGPSPFGRPLRYGDSGGDVSQLAEFLLLLDLVEPDDVRDRFSWTMHNAVRDFNELRGAPTPDGVFEPGSVLWIGRESVSVESFNVQVGEELVGANEPLGFTGFELVAVQVRDLSDLSGISDRPLVVDVGTRRIDLADDGTVATRELTELAAELEAGVETDLALTVRYRSPESLAKVPSSSLISTARATCIVVRRGSGPALAEHVHVAGGILGLAILSDVEVGGEVLANPQSVEWRSKCD